MKIFSIVALVLLAGCSPMGIDPTNPEPPQVQVAPLADKLANLPKNAGPAIPVAVYSFNDKTGQRKPADNMSSLSSAVTQGAEVWVINALKEAGGGGWTGARCGRRSSGAAAPVTAFAPSDDSMLESHLCVSADGETAGAVDAMYGAATSQA